MGQTKSLSSSEVDWISRLAVEVGDWLKSEQPKASVVSQKDNQTPLANVDVTADRRISEALIGRFPGIPVLSEEGQIPSYELRRDWSKYWLVDPLDGTKEFLAQRDDYTVNIGLIFEKRPVFGVVYAPGTQELFWTDGTAAFKAVGTVTKRIFSRAQVGQGEKVIVFESRSHPSPETEAYLSRFAIEKRVGLGSSLKICRLAEGAGHLYPRLGPTMEWDIGAADAIYRASGKDGFNFSPLLYNKESLKNPNFVLGIKSSEPQPL